MININGGRSIGSGGFGCVFRPSIRCGNKEGSQNYISKLMLKEDAVEELEEIKTFSSILKKIKNYKNYFLIDDITLCKVSTLSKEDLYDFNNKCKSLYKNDFIASNINFKLNQLLMLNMPYGGINLSSYIEEHPSSITLKKLHISLINLFKNGIIPMNKKDLYHCDIKASNVLVLESAKNILYPRLIDWGLSVYFKNKKQIPDNLFRRPFQFNTPFSIIIFSDTFVNLYQEFLNNTPNPTNYLYREFTINFILKWIQERGMGHLNAINKLISKLYSKSIDYQNKSNILKYDFTYYHIIEYIASILENFTINGTFHVDKYFKEVFIKNIDIWGFICCYYPIYDLLYENYNSLNNNDLELMNNLKYLIIHFQFENSTNPISYGDLLLFLERITPLFYNSLIIEEKN